MTDTAPAPAPATTNAAHDIDAQIVDLLNERFQRAMIIGVAKALLGEEVQNPKQEEHVIQSVLEINRESGHPTDEGYLESVFRTMMRCAVDLQQHLLEHWPAGVLSAPSGAAAKTLQEQRTAIGKLNGRLVSLLQSRRELHRPAPPFAATDASTESRGLQNAAWAGYLTQIFRAIAPEGDVVGDPNPSNDPDT